MADHPGVGRAPADIPGSPRLTRRIDERLTRLGVTGRFARDCLLAAGVTVATFALLTTFLRFATPVEGLSVDPARARVLVAVVSVQALVLCLRRVRPRLCLGLVVGLQVVVTAVVPSEATVRGLAPLVAAYTVGTLFPVRTALLLAGAATVAEASGVVAVTAGVAPDILVTALGHLASGALSYLGATFVGSYVATHRRYLELVRVRADEALRAHREKVRAAIGAERARMARELHDVAAHHLSGMVVQAAAVERLIDRDPAAAKAGVAWIRGQGKETLDNLRLVVGVLRGRSVNRGGADTAGHDDDNNAPVPGLVSLDDLVRTARDLGASVEFVREGPQREVPPIADVALYRMVQECLSNARQHAPGAPVRVELRFLPREVALGVSNEPATRGPEPAARTGGGVGLVGMRERAQLIGARFAAGPTPPGGWSVTVRLPTGRDDAPTGSTATATKGEDPA
ncbi:sensor histidine kinase [Micromonospora sp. NBC_01412]|uniref:sensor histidine kinase n=1 Tax=Micromonospora sp. NBC_01412 TaxID=2903590 RepID=UPI00324575E2